MAAGNLAGTLRSATSRDFQLRRSAVSGQLSTRVLLYLEEDVQKIAFARDRFDFLHLSFLRCASSTLPLNSTFSPSFI